MGYGAFRVIHRPVGEKEYNARILASSRSGQSESLNKDSLPVMVLREIDRRLAYLLHPALSLKISKKVRRQCNKR